MSKSVKGKIVDWERLANSKNALPKTTEIKKFVPPVPKKEAGQPSGHVPAPAVKKAPTPVVSKKVVKKEVTSFKPVAPKPVSVPVAEEVEVADETPATPPEEIL
jgi:hypothetical protein